LKLRCPFIILAIMLVSSSAIYDVKSRPAWMYKRCVTITENSGCSLDDFPITVMFEHYGHIQPDGDDVRVVIDGNEVPRYASVNTTHAEITFEVDLNASSSKIIYVTYGNPSATTPRYSLVPLTISEGNTGYAVIDNEIYLGWNSGSDYWNVDTVWTEYRLDFNGNGDPRDDYDLITSQTYFGAIGRHTSDLGPAYGLGSYISYVQTPIYVEIIFNHASLIVYKNHHWIETKQADLLLIYSNSWDYAAYQNGPEENIVDGQGTLPNIWNPIYDLKDNPGWMAYRDSVRNLVIAGIGYGIGKDYNYTLSCKEAWAWERCISFDYNETTVTYSDPHDQPLSAQIFWFGDNSNSYSNVEKLASILHNPPTTQVGAEELYWYDLLSEGLVAYYKFDSGQGNVAYDYSGNGNDGIVLGASWTKGKFGYGLSFDGIDDYVNCGLQNFGSELGEPTTYAFWLKTAQNKSAPVGDYGVRLMGSENDGLRTTMLIEPNVPAIDKFNIILKDEDSRKLGVRLKDAFDFTGTGWHHFAFVIEPKANIVDIYVDGVKREVAYYYQETPNRFSDFQYPFVIGAGYCAGIVETFYEGVIDEVRIYNRGLSEDEIRVLSGIYPPYELHVLALKNGSTIPANITLLDENGSIIEAAFSVGSCSWTLQPGTYYVQASFFANEHNYNSERIKVNFTGYTELAINFLFSNLTVACSDVEFRTLAGCTLSFQREDEEYTLYADGYGKATLEAYYGNWTVKAYRWSVPVGEGTIHANSSAVDLFLQCNVGDLTAVMVDQFGNPSRGTITLTNGTYDLTLYMSYVEEWNYTFSQIPLIEYDLTAVTWDYDTQSYHISTDKTRLIQVEIIPLHLKIIYIFVGLIIGSFVMWVFRRRKTRQTTIQNYVK